MTAKTKKKISDLEQANADLRGSLEKCRELLSECRSKLAANSNDADGGQAMEQEPGRKRG